MVRGELSNVHDLCNFNSKVFSFAQFKGEIGSELHYCKKKSLRCNFRSEPNSGCWSMFVGAASVVGRWIPQRPSRCGPSGLVAWLSLYPFSPTVIGERLLDSLRSGLCHGCRFGWWHLWRNNEADLSTKCA